MFPSIHGWKLKVVGTNMCLHFIEKTVVILGPVGFYCFRRELGVIHLHVHRLHVFVGVQCVVEFLIRRCSLLKADPYHLGAFRKSVGRDWKLKVVNTSRHWGKHSLSLPKREQEGLWVAYSFQRFQGNHARWNYDGGLIISP